jgi:hypothetical protein
MACSPEDRTQTAALEALAVDAYRVIAALECPLWVISGHKRADQACSLYPQDGHAQNGHQGLLSAINRHLSGNSRVLKAAIYATEAPPQGEERRG